MRVRRTAWLALALAVLTPACGVWAGLGEKEQWARSIRDAHRAAAAHSTARAVLSVEVEPIDTSLREPPEPLIDRMEGVTGLQEGAGAVLEIREPADLAEGAMAFDDLVLLLPRDPARGGLPWAAYDFSEEGEEDFDVTDRRLGVGFNPFSPPVLLQLLAGVLTGSVERSDRSDDEPGVDIFTANFSNDAALRDLDEDRIDAIIRTFRAIGVGGEVFPGEVWIDDEGLPRRIQYSMEQRQDVLNLFRVTVTLELSDFGVVPEATPPGAGERQRAERFSELIEEFLRRAD